MKKLFLSILSVVAITIGWRSEHAAKIVNQKDAEAKCSVIIDRVSYLGIGGLNGEMKSGINVNVLLVNNSADTLIYAYSRCLDTLFYSIDFKNLTPVDANYNCKGKDIVRTIILPHKYAYARLGFIYRKPQTADFKFKIGFHFLKWKNTYKVTTPNKYEIEHADLLWSDTQLFDINGSRSVRNETQIELRERAKLIYDTLRTDQRKNYVLKINQGQISQIDGINCADQKVISLIVPLRLINNSSDTLVYTNMTCDWDMIYFCNKTQIKVLGPCVCEANFPAQYKIAPHKDTLFQVTVYYDLTSAKPGTRFKLGMTLLKENNIIQFEDFVFYAGLLSNTPGYNILSNEVEIPKFK